MTNRSIDTTDVRARHSASSVISRYVHLVRRGRELVGLCPFHTERTPSFSVNDEKGLFQCFGCGASGDVIAFVRNMEGLGFREAVAFIEQGPTSPPLSSHSTKRCDTAEVARRLWAMAEPIDATIGEAYLVNRGLQSAPRHAMEQLRFAWLRYPGSGERHPAIIAAAADCCGEISGVQRTFLTNQGGKLPVQKPKLSLGHIKGCAIRLGPPAAEITLCEGLEDGLSILSEMPERTIWVAAGASMISSMWLPPACQTVVIAADNDNAGVASAHSAAAVFQRQGREVRIARPAYPHKDFNDQLRATAP